MCTHPLAQASWWSGEPRAHPDNHPLPLFYRLAEDEPPGEGQGEYARDARLAMLEAALVSAEEPLSTRRLARVAGIGETAEVRRLAARLKELYEKEGSAFQLEEIAGGYQLLTHPAVYRWLTRLRRTGKDLRLSAAARETLTIVAYRQPLTRADIEAIRGVNVGDVLNLLLDRGLVRTAGRHDSLGRPMLYATTKKFLQVYGLRSLRDLPEVAELEPPKKEGTPGG
jgi:segregation and condensation protein B